MNLTTVAVHAVHKWILTVSPPVLCSFPPRFCYCFCFSPLEMLMKDIDTFVTDSESQDERRNQGGEEDDLNGCYQ